jgi:hypothetical protein
MSRLVTTLIFVISFDILLTGGQYTAIVDQIALAVVQHF